MWIKVLPDSFCELSSGAYNNVFLWRKDNVFVMDNHGAALWCWLKTCSSKKSYNFMHIDRHYDLSDCFKDDDLAPLKNTPQIGFQEYADLRRWDGKFKLIRWDNYIRAGYSLYKRWFHSNIFLTHEEGDKASEFWGHKPLPIREKNPLFMECYIREFIEESCKWPDEFSGNDYKLPWIVNLDLDVFYTGESHIQLFSDDYIMHIAEMLQNNLKRIAVLTIAISPDCLGGKSQCEKWANGFRILRVMSRALECLREFENDCVRISSERGTIPF